MNRTAALLAGVALTGCASTPQVEAGPLQSSGPTGYPVDSRATRSHLSADQVAQVLPSDPDLTKPQLTTLRAAASKVFRAPDGSFQLSVVMRFHTDAQAAGFRDFEVNQITQRASLLDPSNHGDATGVFPTASLAGASTFVLGGESRAGGKVLFLQGVVFAVGERTYLVETGGPTPAITADAEQLATQLAAAAAQSHDGS